MTLLLSPDDFPRLAKKLGKEETSEIVEALDSALLTITEKRVTEAIEKISDKADFLITQRKFELKDELTKELATKADIARLEGEQKTTRQEIQTVRQEIQTIVVKLDRKFTILFLILLFTIIFLNQNSLEFIARLFGLVKP